MTKLIDTRFNSTKNIRIMCIEIQTSNFNFISVSGALNKLIHNLKTKDKIFISY